MASHLAIAVAHELPLNEAVRQETILQTICVSGYTKSIRPPTAFTNKIKLGLIKREGLDASKSGEYELDHIIPLAIGGHPRKAENLILQPWDSASRKDRLEVKLQCLVCNGQVALEEAQTAIFDDWEAVYHSYSKVKCGRLKVSRASNP